MNQRPGEFANFSFFLPVFIGFILLGNRVLATIQVERWDKINEKNGIEVFQGKVAGSNLLAFRGVTTLPFAIKKVASVMHDPIIKSRWMERTKEHLIVQKISDLERIEYSLTRTPWPLKDRDFLFNVKVIPYPQEKKIEVSIKSVEMDQYPKKDGIVRGELIDSTAMLEMVDKESTRVMIELRVDTKGSIPNWVTNLVQKNWPVRSFQGISRELALPDFAVSAEIESLFQKYVPKNIK